MHLESQRGQTMPFWVIGILVALSTLFFLSNYANAVIWQYRAQTAADSAASAVLSVQANTYNEYNVMLYAATVDEYRLRSINQAMLNLFYGVGGCKNYGHCQQDYNDLQNEYDAALQAYTDSIHLLDQANNFTQAGQATDQQKALTMMQNGTFCTTAGDYACSFGITSLATGTSSSGALAGGGYNKIDLIACKKMSYWGAALLNLGNAGTFNVVGRAAAAIIPAKSESFNPGTTTNASTGQAYQPTEYWSTTDKSSPLYAVDFSGLNVDVNWYIAGAVHPFATSAGTFTCK